MRGRPSTSRRFGNDSVCDSKKATRTVLGKGRLVPNKTLCVVMGEDFVYSHEATTTKRDRGEEGNGDGDDLVLHRCDSVCDFSPPRLAS